MRDPMLDGSTTEPDWVDAQLVTTSAPFDSGGVWNWDTTNDNADFRGFNPGIPPTALTTNFEAYLEPTGYPTAFAAGSPGTST